MDKMLELAKSVKSIRIDESLSSILKQRVQKEKSHRFIPIDYFYVTHLTNPMQFYWEQKKKDIEKTNEIARKLLLGKKLERTARKWFRNLPSFLLEEGKLDGAWVDIPGVRGNIDYKIGESIIEFKTKDKLPETEKEILEKYPNDIEQLIFYAVLHPDKPIENYLVFMNNIPPYKLKAFKIKIISQENIKNLLKNRIKLLQEAIKTDNPSKLGRCRYFESGCGYNTQKICECSKYDSLPNEILKNSIIISFDEEFTKSLENSKDLSSNLEDLFSTKDIIAPRKYYLNKHLGIKEEWESDNKREGYLSCLSYMVKGLSLNLNSKELEYINQSLKEPRLYIAQRWLKIKSSSKPEGEILPYIVKISSIKDKSKISKPSSYFLAELSIICSVYGKSKGLIFIVYPELNDYVQVYEIVYDDISNTLHLVKSILDNLENAIKNKDLSLIHSCPEFMNDNEKCPLIKECHDGKIKGCITKK